MHEMRSCASSLVTSFSLSVSLSHWSHYVDRREPFATVTKLSLSITANFHINKKKKGKEKALSREGNWGNWEN